MNANFKPQASSMTMNADDLARAAELEARRKALLEKMHKAGAPAPAKIVVKNEPVRAPARDPRVVCKGFFLFIEGELVQKECELEGGLFVPAKATYKRCPSCSNLQEANRKLHEDAERKKALMFKAEERKLEVMEQALKDFASGAVDSLGKPLACQCVDCGMIEKPGQGYNPDWDFHCFACREEYRSGKKREPRRDSRPAPAYSPSIIAPPANPAEAAKKVVRKAVTDQVLELFANYRSQGMLVAGMPERLKADLELTEHAKIGARVHQIMGRQVTLKITAVIEGKSVSFHENVTVPETAEDRRAARQAIEAAARESQRAAEEARKAEAKKKEAANKAKKEAKGTKKKGK